MRIKPSERVDTFKKAIKNGMNMLTVDIETSHMIIRSFFIGNKISIYHHQIKEPSQVISIQYLWNLDKRAKFLQWEDISDTVHDDRKMLNEFATDILPKADIVLTQNGDKFDFLTLNERLKAQHLELLQFKPSIDILKLSRKSFKAASHKLDYRSQQQGLGGKIIMVDQDWVDIEEKGVPVSKKMAPYGCKDVEDTVKLFWKELPYYKDLPLAIEKVVLSFISKGRPACPKCDRIKKPKYNITCSNDKKGEYICNNCGTNFKFKQET